jgi:PAS domain S-box-containing protein
MRPFGEVVGGTGDGTDPQETEDRWRSLLENVPGYVMTLDREGTILFLNRPWPQMTTGEVVGTSVFRYLSAEEHPPVRELLDRVYRTSEPATYEIRTADGSGREVWYSSRVGVIRGAGRPVALIVVTTDITRQKQAEETARRRQEELAHVSRTSTMGEVAAIIAHELNNPLSAIANFAAGCTRRLRLKDIDKADLSDALQEIVRLATRSSETISRLRKFLQKRDRQIERAAVGELLRDAAELARSHATRRSMWIRLDLTGDPLPLVAVDRIQIAQVLVNLIVNGLDALRAVGGRGQEIVVRAAPAADAMVVVSVEDSGCGLPADFESCIFEPFFSTKPDGLGIGLSISRSIVESHGGRLWARPNDGPGATFLFTLPVANGGHPHA